jgi:phage tail-like protein
MLKTNTEKTRYRTIVPKMLENGTITLDSGIVSCQWHRIYIETMNVTNRKINEVQISTFEKEGEISDCSQIVSLDGDGLFKNCYIDCSPGRYIAIKFIGTIDDIENEIRIAEVYYPRKTYIKYLPETYSENAQGKEFLDRFLSLFETVLTKTDQKIENFSNLFDPRAVTLPIDMHEPCDSSWSEWLDWLSDYVSIDLYDQLPVDRKRDLLKKSVEYYKKKGTLEGIAELVEFLINAQVDLQSNKNTNPIKVMIKELKNNLFRSYSEQDDHDAQYKKSEKKDDDIQIGYKCKQAFHGRSLTFDSKNIDMIQNMNTPDDSLHYTFGLNNETDHFYSNTTICIYIFLDPDNMTMSENELHTMIKSFLPVFVKAEVIFRYVKEESFIEPIVEKTRLFLRLQTNEQYEDISGTYTDTKFEWNVLKSNERSHLTNRSEFRSFHSAFIQDLPI